jgi:hypothetical protein
MTQPSYRNSLLQSAGSWFDARWQWGAPWGDSSLYSSIILTPISLFYKNWSSRFKSEITSV